MKYNLLKILVCMIGICLAENNKKESSHHTSEPASIVETLGKISDHLGLPINSSSHGLLIDNMIGWVHWLMILLFIGWGIYLIIAMIKFNSKTNPKADYHGVQSHYSQYAEYGVIVFEAFLLIGLSIPLYTQLKTTLPEDNVHHVRVIAQQFAWNMHYPGEDGKFGNTNIDLVDEEFL